MLIFYISKAFFRKFSVCLYIYIHVRYWNIMGCKWWRVGYSPAYDSWYFHILKKTFEYIRKWQAKKNIKKNCQKLPCMIYAIKTVLSVFLFNKQIVIENGINMLLYLWTTSPSAFAIHKSGRHNENFRCGWWHMRGRHDCVSESMVQYKNQSISYGNHSFVLQVEIYLINWCLDGRSQFDCLVCADRSSQCMYRYQPLCLWTDQLKFITHCSKRQNGYGGCYVVAGWSRVYYSYMTGDCAWPRNWCIYLFIYSSIYLFIFRVSENCDSTSELGMAICFDMILFSKNPSSLLIRMCIGPLP